MRLRRVTTQQPSGQATTTDYAEGGVFERDSGATQAERSFYFFNGQVVAQRSTVWDGTNTTVSVIYLHGDHLGSISLATGATGVRVSNQDFDPWGKVRPGNTITQTPLNYTGQHLDGNGLLDYHARLYDPTIARFISADSVVPGAGPLTLAPGDATAAAAWAAGGGGPANPQALNRYSYVNNNPLRYTDPTGHYYEKGGDSTAGYETVCQVGGKIASCNTAGAEEYTDHGETVVRTYVQNEAAIRL